MASRRPSTVVLFFAAIGALGMLVIAYGALSRGNSQPTEGPSSHAADVKTRYEAELLKIPHVVGVGLGAGAVIEVYLSEDSAEARRQIPTELEGVPVRVVVTGEFQAR